MPDLSATASFFEAPARAAASTTGNASSTPSGVSAQSGVSEGVDPANIASEFANLVLANQQPQPDTPVPDAAQFLAGDGPTTPLALAPENGEVLFATGVHPGERGLEQAIEAGGLQQAISVATPLELLAEPGSGAVDADPVDVDGPVSANSLTESSLLAEKNGGTGDNPLPDAPAPVGPPAPAHNGAAAGDLEPVALGAVGKPVASILNGQSEIDDETGEDGETHGDPEIAASSTDASNPSEQSRVPIAGPESTPGAAAKAIAWSLAPEQGALSAPGTPGAQGTPNGNAANPPEFTPFPPPAADAKGPAAPGKSDPTGAGSAADDAEQVSARGNENAASENRPPVAEASSHRQFAQLLNSEFGERSGLPSSSSLGTPEIPVSASPAGMASPVVRAAFQTTSGAPPSLPVRALAVHIAQRFDNGDRRFEIRLDPPELGRIDVRMAISRDGHVTAQLTADHPETLDALQRDARGLERALQTAGLDTGENGLSFQLREQQPDEHHAPGDGANTEGEDDPLAADEALPGHVISLTAIDIRV